jgi:hypothetical protein
VKKSIGQHFRQGDVLTLRVNSIPSDAKPVPRDERGLVVLAWGELTNHSHAIATKDAALKSTDAGRTYLEITGTELAELVHEEHKTIPHEIGKYRVVRQSEYSPAALRNVAD